MEPTPRPRRPGRRVPIAILALVLLAVAAVAYRTVAARRELDRLPARADYRALLAGDRDAIESCRGPELTDLEGGQGFGAEEVIAAIARDVERIRELEFDSLPDVQLVSDTEFADRLEDAAGAGARDGDEDYAKLIRLEDRMLTMLGALDPAIDLRRVHGGAPSGIYLHEDDEILVVGSEDFIDPDTRVTLAHELAHGVVDQRFGLGRFYRRIGDAALAGRALVEGDATLTDFRFGRWALSSIDRWLIDFVGEEYQPAGGPPSHFLRRAGSFPYRAGPAFVCRLHQEGGWEKVNEAFEDPPRTTAEVLFPARYDSDENAVPPALPALLPAPWRLGLAYPFGAAPLQWLFEAPGDDRSRGLDEPLERAAGWAGGQVWLWVDGKRSALLLSLVQRSGEPPLCDSVSEWYEATFRDFEFLEGKTGREWVVTDGVSTDGVVSCFQDHVRVALAPDLRTARALAHSS